MGLAVPTALGLALAQPDKRILALTGDGEMMMGIGSLGVVADQAPKNLAILVLDNEHFGETGRQTGLDVEPGQPQRDRQRLRHQANDGGDRTQAPIDDLAEFVFKTPGPVFATAKIAISEDPWMLPVKDGVAIARRFRVALGVEQA